MTKDEFLLRLRSALHGLSPEEVAEIVDEYRDHFQQAELAGRRDDETAAALGNPDVLAAEYVRSTHYEAWQQQRRPVSFIRWCLVSLGMAALLPLAGLLALLAVVAVVAIVLVGVGAMTGSALLLSLLVPAIIGVLVILGPLAVIAGRAYATRGSVGRSGAGDSNIVEQELQWTPGTEVAISVPVEVHWKPSAVPRATVRGQRRQVERLDVGNGRIGGPIHWQRNRADRVRIDLESAAIECWTIFGNARLSLEGVAQPALRLEIVGNGEIRAEGETEELYLRIAGSGRVDTKELKQRHAVVNIQGSGHVTVTPTEEAKLNIAGSGSIVLCEKPRRLSEKVAGSGHIRILGGLPAEEIG